MSKDEHFGRHFLGGLLRLSPLDSAKYLYLTVWLRPLTIQLLKDNYIPEFIYRHLLSQQLSYKSVNVHKVESAGFMSSCVIFPLWCDSALSLRHVTMPAQSNVIMYSLVGP